MPILNAIYRIVCYFWHTLTAVNTAGYGIHSPLLFYWTRFLINETYPYYCFKDIENERERLLRARKKIFVEDFGTGKSEERTLRHIAQTSLMSKQEAQILFRLLYDSQPEAILELGTNLGITTSYIANACPKAKITTMEGSREILEEARKIWEKLEINNITAIEGNIDNTLPEFVKQVDKLNWVIIDANHTEKATLEYYKQILPLLTESSIVVIDDIYYSPEMHRAWKTIRDTEEVTCSINLFDMGILFYNKNLLHKHFKIRI